VRDRKCLREEIREVVAARPPQNDVVAKGHAVTDPVVAHIDGFGATPANGLSGNAESGGVVGDERRWRLWVTKVGQGGTEGRGRLTVEEKAGDLGFRGRSDDGWEDGADNVDAAINRAGSGVAEGGNIMEPTNARPSVSFGQIRGVRPNNKTHGAGSESDTSVGVPRGILEEVHHISP